MRVYVYKLEYMQISRCSMFVFICIFTSQTHLDKCILHSRTDVHEVHTLTACTKLPCDASWGMSCRAIMIVRLRQQCRQSLTLAQASNEVRTQIENFAGTSWGRLPMISQANWSVFVGARLQNAPCTPC